ncbi:DUF3718 domain-containing protein [Shewanella sp. D64]|uniref:DUF3718 domain-containing protein n=1 Tax=unclassified Shewanella TaxID=196818 RepID=UPI0022BA5DAD|nr:MULTISPECIES: DUF3718 domain-containing protein [unclassified Shewanella]MEC4727042.1 DUF3718 domain-containing protein [Shewanella sp. D64]MEC4737781.1 DUF3718 domain-containing protein [Shewanella sp. E94]WBJ93961.1 DUF3718 domain-containing protein [Shewanella sp. MTB7]
MKKRLIIATLILTPLAFNVTAAMHPQLEKTLVDVCKAGASNSVYKLRDTVKSYRINEQRIYPRLICNGETFHQFVLSQGADKTAKHIGRYMRGTVTIKDLVMSNSSDGILAVTY